MTRQIMKQMIYVLQFLLQTKSILNIVIQTCNVSNKKSQTLKDDFFTKFSYSMMMEEFEYHNLFK
jgi:hypothetical protein